MKRAVQRIGPLVPALATVGASIAVSSLLLGTGPRTLGPHPVVPPFPREVGRVVASLSPPAQPPSRGRAPVVHSPGRHSLSAPARGSAPTAPSLHRSSRQVGRVGASAAPPPSPPSPPPAPPVTPQPSSEPGTQAPTQDEKRSKDGNRPGWGHGDPNHDHTGPPGKGSKRQEDKATTVGAGAPPAKGSKRQQDKATTVGAGVPAAVGDQHDPHQNGEKKSPGH